MTQELRQPSILFKIGPIGIARKPNCLQTYRTLPSGETENFKKLWGHLMLQTRSSGLRMAKASMEDIEAIRSLIDEGREYFEKWENDEISAEHLIDRFDGLLDAAEIAEGRVLFGFETILENEVFDPDKSYLDLHPEIIEGLWLRRYFGWLIWLMNAIKIRPWNW